MILLLGGLLFYSDFASAASFIVNPNKTYTYSNMKSDINKLKKAYPDLVDSKVIGTTEFGRNIYAVSLGKGDSTVFLNGSHHAREWITTNVNMNMIDKYAYAYKKNTKINGYKVRTVLNNTTIWFVPMVNPDGVTLQQSGLKNFPKSAHEKLIKMNNGTKNFKHWKANGTGVDLNRQYNANWREIKGPKSPSFKNYKGKTPASAIETKTILSFVQDIDPEMAISYHSSGQILFWNYQQSGTRYTRDYGYAKKLRNITGYSLVYPKSFGGGGGFSDWFSRVENKPAYTIEVAPYAGETNVPIKLFPKIWNENSIIGLYIAQEGFKLYDTRETTASIVLEQSIKTYNSKTASTLQQAYGSNNTSIKKLIVSDSLNSKYKKVTAEIKKQEKAIAKLPANYRSKPNTALSKTKTYHNNTLAYMNGISAGDSLITKNQALINALENGNIHSATVDSYQKLVSRMNSTKTTLSKMVYSHVRALANTKYIVPVQDFTASAGFEFKRYQLLLVMDEQINSNEYLEARENMNKLKKLNAESAAFKKKAPTRYKTFATTEAYLMALQTDIEQALTKAKTPKQPPVEPERPLEDVE